LSKSNIRSQKCEEEKRFKETIHIKQSIERKFSTTGFAYYPEAS
jgi:hypothetical protein